MGDKKHDISMFFRLPRGGVLVQKIVDDSVWNQHKSRNPK